MAEKMVFKTRDYIITGIWYMEMDGKKYISHVMLHECESNRRHYIGKKTAKDKVIELIDDDKRIFTAMWQYSSDGAYLVGAKVDYEEVNGINYLRTERDASEKDNLHNLIDMSEFDLKFN